MLVAWPGEPPSPHSGSHGAPSFSDLPDHIKVLIFSFIPEAHVSTKRLLPVVSREFSRICAENAKLLWSSVWLDLSIAQGLDGVQQFDYLSSEDMGPVYAWVARHLPVIEGLTVSTDESMTIRCDTPEVFLPTAP